MKRSKSPEILDVSTVISDKTEVYPGDPKPVISLVSDTGARVSLLSIGTHTGTHVDPPLHLFEGRPGVDEVYPGSLIGWAEIHDLSHCREVTASDLKELRFREDIILLKTGRKESYLTGDAARYIAGLGPKALGIDSLSVDPADTTDAHRTVLETGAVIIEGLRFEGVQAGRYFFICLPLRIKDGDGGPARAVLVKDMSQFCSDGPG